MIAGSLAKHLTLVSQFSVFLSYLSSQFVMSSSVNFENELLLAAYEEYDNNAEEWPNFKEFSKKYLVGNKPVPLLIRECSRLVPVHSRYSDFVQFHPFNMPNIRVKRIHLMGMILNIKMTQKYVHFAAYDGTGNIEIIYKLQAYENQLKIRAEIDKKYEVSSADVPRYERLMKLKIEERYRSSVAQQRIRQFQQNHKAWWDQCQQGMLGSPLRVGSYVHIFGFCNINLNNIRGHGVKNNNFWANDVMPELIFNAYKVQCMSEKSYNETIQKWVDTVFKEKYVRTK